MDLNSHCTFISALSSIFTSQGMVFLFAPKYGLDLYQWQNDQMVKIQSLESKEVDDYFNVTTLPKDMILDSNFPNSLIAVPALL